MGVLLWLFCEIVKFTFFIPAMLHKLIDGIRYRDLFRRVNESFSVSAYINDVLGNTMYSELFNAYFIKKGGYHYGSKKETISSSTGKNWIMRTLTMIGEGFVGVLNGIDTDHCWKYIEGERPDFPKPTNPKRFHVFMFLMVFTALFLASAWLAWWVVKLIAIFIVKHFC